MYITAPENDLSIEQKQLIAKGLLIMAGTINRQVLTAQSNATIANECENAGINLDRWAPAALEQAERCRNMAMAILLDTMLVQYADKSGLGNVEAAKICFDLFDKLSGKLSHMNSDDAFAFLQSAIDKAFSDAS